MGTYSMACQYSARRLEWIMFMEKQLEEALLVPLATCKCSETLCCIRLSFPWWDSVVFVILRVERRVSGGPRMIPMTLCH